MVEKYQLYVDRHNTLERASEQLDKTIGILREYISTYPPPGKYQGYFLELEEAYTPLLDYMRRLGEGEEEDITR